MLGAAAIRLLLLGLVASTLPSCAASPSEPVGPAAPATETPLPTGTTDPPAPASELVIVVTRGGGSRTVWRLTCDPPGGDHPDPAAACGALEARFDTLRPVPKDRRCAEVYGGPETASVTGTWRGRQVLSTFSRTNACESARWSALQGLLPAPGS